MQPVLVAAFVGFVIGLLRRPYGAHIHQAALVLPITGVVGVAAQIAGATFGLSSGGHILGISLALLTGFALVNRHIVGMGVLGLGLGLNLAVVLANGAMPVRAQALVDAGVVDVADLSDVDLGFGRQFEQRDDLLVPLGDIIPEPLFGAAMSFGDLIALAGIGAVAGDLARHSRRGQTWSVGRSAPEREPIRPRFDFDRPVEPDV